MFPTAIDFIILFKVISKYGQRKLEASFLLKWNFEISSLIAENLKIKKKKKKIQYVVSSRFGFTTTTKTLTLILFWLIRTSDLTSTPMNSIWISIQKMVAACVFFNVDNSGVTFSHLYYSCCTVAFVHSKENFFYSQYIVENFTIGSQLAGVAWTWVSSWKN